jgi:O-antigen chain-terminating methyltransferase
LLELLRDEGLPASGVDSNRAAVEQCTSRKLDVSAGDAFEALHKISDGTLGALTAIHVVEHLPLALLFKLLDEALRVLRPAGVAIFETPNPQNLLVGACNFYVDPTHRNPIHPQTLQYLVEARGMVRVETLMLHPYPPEKRLPEDSPLARTFNDYFYGPQDFAVVGRRP